MMKAAADILRCRVLSDDGPLGDADGFWFDDRDWAVRYLQVRLDDEAQGPYAMVAAVEIEAFEADGFRLHLRLSRRVLRDSPAVQPEAHLPRETEMGLIAHFNWPPYWADAPVLKGTRPRRPTVSPDATVATMMNERVPQLRSIAALRACQALACDESTAGPVSDAVVETTAWEVRYVTIMIDGEGPPILAPPDWIRRAEWDRGRLVFALSGEALRTSPVEHPTTQLKSAGA